MKQKYIMPKAELIVIKANAILVGSTRISDDGLLNLGNGGVATENAVGARSPLATDIWEDIDETNGYK